MTSHAPSGGGSGPVAHAAHHTKSLLERIGDLEKRQEEVNDEEGTQDMWVAEAYIEAAKEHLAHPTKKEFYSLSKLRQGAVREKMAEALHKGIIKRHQAARGDNDKSNYYHDQLSNMYTGMTKAELLGHLGKYQSGLNIQKHQAEVTKRIGEARKRFQASAINDALGGEEYHEQNLEAMGLKDMKDQYSPDQSRQLLLEFLGTEQGRAYVDRLRSHGSGGGHAHH